MVKEMTQEEIDMHVEYIARLEKQHREREKREATERGEYLWYVVLRHSNRRILFGDGEVEIFDDYDTASKRAAGISRTMKHWYVPTRISEYNKTFGRFNTTRSLTINIDGWVTINIGDVVKED